MCEGLLADGISKTDLARCLKWGAYRYLESDTFGLMTNDESCVRCACRRHQQDGPEAVPQVGSRTPGLQVFGGGEWLD